AERTSRIALATGVVTLPIDDPLRAAEDAAVLDALCGGRVQLGIAAGGTPSSFPAFGRDPAARRELFAEHLAVLRDALAGRGVRGTGSRIYPSAGDLGQRIWQATFSASGGTRAGADGDGPLLSRPPPRPGGSPRASSPPAPRSWSTPSTVPSPWSAPNRACAPSRRCSPGSTPRARASRS